MNKEIKGSEILSVAPQGVTEGELISQTEWGAVRELHARGMRGTPFPPWFSTTRTADDEEEDEIYERRLATSCTGCDKTPREHGAR